MQLNGRTFFWPPWTALPEIETACCKSRFILEHNLHFRQGGLFFRQGGLYFRQVGEIKKSGAALKATAARDLEPRPMHFLRSAFPKKILSGQTQTKDISMYDSVTPDAWSRVAIWFMVLLFILICIPSKYAYTYVSRRLLQQFLLFLLLSTNRVRTGFVKYKVFEQKKIYT